MARGLSECDMRLRETEVRAIKSSFEAVFHLGTSGSTWFSWFELREIRNEIAHDYEDDEAAGISILNGIIVHKDELKRIVSLFRHRALDAGRT